MIDYYRLIHDISSPPLFHLLIISLIYWITWIYSVRGEFVSDDIEGLQKFSDRLDKNNVIDYYEFDPPKYINLWKFGPSKISKDNEKLKVRCKNKQFNPYVEFPGSIIRWLRLNLGSKWKVLGKNEKGHEVTGYVQSPFKHHIISLVIHFLNAILTYLFLSNIIDPRIAFMATLLFIVHPVSVQVVAWCSGIGYMLSLLGMLISYNISIHTSNLYILIPSVVASTLISITGLLSGSINFLILAFLGEWWASATALAVTLIFGIKWLRWVVNYRTTEFKKQKMERSTYVTWRKPIVIVKTFFYYLKTIIFPKRLGLFHEWGYHYEEKLEHADLNFWGGLISIIAIWIWFKFTVFPIQFGILWFFSYLILFSNIITAQQFVADRYAFISTLGYSIIISTLLVNQPILFAFILGLYMMRTWQHIPTFENEVHFYQSNYWNFPKSEVALGNLGVIYVNQQLTGTAMDTWYKATKINPDYDVPWYNLYSIFRANGLYTQAKEVLEKCLNAKVCHFPDNWGEEYKRITQLVELTKPINEQIKIINKGILEAKYEHH